MKYHANATLTVHQRRSMRKEFQEGASIVTLAARYHVTTKTVQKWVHRDDPADRSSAPRRRRSKRPPGLKRAVKEHKRLNPDRGTRSIADHLRRYFPGLTRSRVRHILKTADSNEDKPSKEKRKPNPLPVGRHRAQMDIQKLPVVQDESCFEYKVSVIHLSTRNKYSEIHDNHKSKTVADVLVRALDRLPPIKLVYTDNALEFTMRFSIYPERQTAFQKKLASFNIKHGTCKPRSPWQNGIIERSHRTDNEALFKVTHFADPEERRYQLRLWEMHYNNERYHQGLKGLIPLEVYQRDYPLHASSRMLIA